MFLDKNKSIETKNFYENISFTNNSKKHITLENFIISGASINKLGNILASIDFTRKKFLSIRLLGIDLVDELSIHMLDLLIKEFLEKFNGRVKFTFSFKNETAKHLMSSSVLYYHYINISENFTYTSFKEIYINDIKGDIGLRYFIPESRLESDITKLPTKYTSIITKGIKNLEYYNMDDTLLETKIGNLIGETLDNFIRHKGDIIFAITFTEDLNNSGNRLLSFSVLSKNGIMLWEKYDEFASRANNNEKLSNKYRKILENVESLSVKNRKEEYIKMASLSIKGVSTQDDFEMNTLEGIDSCGGGLGKIISVINESVESKINETSDLIYIYSGEKIIKLLPLEGINVDNMNQKLLNEKIYDYSIMFFDGVAYNFVFYWEGK